MPRSVTCPECGAAFVTSHNSKAFCSPAHKERFYNLMAQRGKVLAPFAQVSRGMKRGKTEERSYALRHYNRLTDRFNHEDKLAGRNVAYVIRDKMSSGWIAEDLLPQVKDAARESAGCPQAADREGQGGVP